MTRFSILIPVKVKELEMIYFMIYSWPSITHSPTRMRRFWSKENHWKFCTPHLKQRFNKLPFFSKLFSSLLSPTKQTTCLSSHSCLPGEVINRDKTKSLERRKKHRGPGAFTDMPEHWESLYKQAFIAESAPSTSLCGQWPMCAFSPNFLTSLKLKN